MERDIFIGDILIFKTVMELLGTILNVYRKYVESYFE